MRLTDDTLRFSATDLSNFGACAHRTLLDRLRAKSEARPVPYDDPLLDLLKERGIAHEEAYLEAARADGKRVVELPLPHTGNSRESREEAQAVVALFRRIVADGATFTDREGTARPLTPQDLLVVAPYNAQVRRIQAALAEAGFPTDRVGTVDKFQGQEAPVAIYSLASSSAEDAPRGMGFLYALDRLNVATSRARCATILVASPEVFAAECRTPGQMRMVNAFARYGEVGVGWGAPPDNMPFVGRRIL